MPGETGNLQQIGRLGVVCEVANLHVVQHALAEQCHGGTPGKSNGNAQLGTSIFLQRVRSLDCPHRTSNHRPG